MIGMKKKLKNGLVFPDSVSEMNEHIIPTEHGSIRRKHSIIEYRTLQAITLQKTIITVIGTHSSGHCKRHGSVRTEIQETEHILKGMDTQNG